MFNIRPGAPEVFDNGVDENCDGRDNPNLDRDADGFAQPGDCDDDNAAVKPGALEVRGNAVDENCDRRAEPFAQLGAVVSNQWLVTRTHAKLLSLVVRLAPQGRPHRPHLQGQGLPQEADAAADRLARPPAHRAAAARSGARACASARG